MDFYPASNHVRGMDTGSAETLKDDSTGTLGRRMDVGGTMAGLAARLAGDKFFGLAINKEAHAAQLTTALGRLKGPLMKIGQILATIPEALPEEYARAFQQLQSDAPPMGWSFVRRRMNTELGAGWEKHFTHFPQEATNAASLGQVHKAQLTDGRWVACKLQYPDMSSTIEADLKNLKTILGLYEMMDKAVKTNLIMDEIADRLREELDYKLEAVNVRRYGRMLADTKNVHVPEVVGDLSTDRLLTLTWLDGNKILSFKDAPIEQRNMIAMNLFHAWYVPLYHYGVIHGDPHLGNYTIRPDSLDLNLLDFGCTRVFPPRFVGAVIDLYRALQTNDEARLVHAFETWGFIDLSREMIDILATWAKFLYGPLLDDKTRVIGMAADGMYGKDTAMHVHERLKAAGGVTVPREFVFMDRAALGLGSVFIHLAAEVNWHQLFESMIDGFDVAKLEANQSRLLTG